MKTFFISEGKTYRNKRFHNEPLKKETKRYLRKITSYSNDIWIYFSKMENDYRLLHKPFNMTLIG